MLIIAQAMHQRGRAAGPIYGVQNTGMGLAPLGSGQSRNVVVLKKLNLTPRLHDTDGCTTGCTIGCIV